MSPSACKVLLIEDNDGDALLLKDMLEEGADGNFRLECSENLMEGFALLAKGGFDVVLLDLGLPESGGIETFHRVKSAYPGTPVIVLTGLDDEAVALAVVHAGAQDYLLKGQTDGRTLRRAIRYAIERKNAEQVLRFTEYALDHSMLGVFWIGTDGRFVNVNRGGCTMLGYSREELLTMTAGDIDAGRFWTTLSGLQKRMPHQGSVGLQSTFRAKDGSLIPVEIVADYMEYDGSGYVFANVYDITEQKRTEEALQLTQFAVDNAVDAIHWIRPDGRPFYVNQAACQALGYSKEELLSMGVRDWDPHAADEAWSRFWNVLKERKRMVFTTEHKTKKGRIFPVEITANYVQYGEKEFVYSSGRDISERILAEEEKSKLQSQLLHAQKMEAIGQLAGGIAHDFNNILTGIIGYGNLLQMNLSAGTPPRFYADSILDSGEKAAKLTQSLLAFSRKQSMQQAPQNLHEILRSLEPLLRRLITEDIDFQIVYDSTDPTIFADSVQIDQVIINLVTNARDAMSGGGTLTVRTGRSKVGPERFGELGLKEPGNYAVLSIEDTGVGMSAEVKARLFDPFFTTKEVGQGTGLGLSIVYGIVGQHGGAISIWSELGKGSRFDVYLPIRETVIARKNPPLLQPIGGNETILLAEDDESVRKMVSTILSVSGYTVVEAVDGEDAVSEFLKYQDEIDLVILDVVMPKKNGREVCEWIRERKPDIRFLFTSGYTKNIIDEKGFSEEGMAFIAKPVHPNDLLDKIRQILRP